MMKYSFASRRIFTIVVILIISGSLPSLYSQDWIWFPGDFENWLGNQMNNRRTERGISVPVQWKLDGHEPLMIFTKNIDLAEPEEVEIWAEGQYVISLGWQIRYNGNENGPTRITLPAGKAELKIKVVNYSTVPAIFVRGKTIRSDETWMASPLEPMRMTVNMKHPDSPSGHSMHAGSGGLNDPGVKPSAFKLPVSPLKYTQVTEVSGGRLYDFGKETFGFVKLHNLSGNGPVTLQFGETREEAMDADHCETFYTFRIPEGKGDYIHDRSSALRYVFVSADNAQFDDLSLLYEYTPLGYRASFKSSDEALNTIWEVGRYTMQLTTREVFIDGIKRDRWAWSGDACQSYLMNYYLFFDQATVKRTMYTLRGADPVISHLNNILDYSFYWFISIYDYYLYTGDKQFLAQIYPKMESLMDYILERRNKDGLVEGLKGDWVYIDWFDNKVDLTGEVSFEQILYCRSLEAMAECAGILGIEREKENYDHLVKQVKSKLENYWDSSVNAFIFNRKEGQNSSQITKHANMFAVNYGYTTPEQQVQIKTGVLMNKNIPAISTPYMRFYELEALCKLGEQNYVLNEMKNYWGGMLKLGATTFWEKYNPESTGLDHYSMYGRPFGKSLCHAWGASPVYLLGKYYVGVKPIQPGYKEFEVRPVLGGLQWFDASVPTPHGDIKVFMDKSRIVVTATEGEGNVVFRSATTPKSDSGSIQNIGADEYTLRISGNGQKVTITYKALN